MNTILWLLLGMALLLTGCATLEANRIELAKWQGMADQATKAMGWGKLR